MAKLRRGFRKEAEEYAAEFRIELETLADGPLCPFRLADHLEIPVLSLSALDAYSEYAAELSEFSAMTIPEGTKRTIFHNQAHHPHRRNSNVMHEIAHIVLGHPPHLPLTKDGCRNFDDVLENEAKELAFALLIPKVAALKIIETKMTLEQASSYYGVSRSLLNYRIRITDAVRYAANRRKRR